MRLCHYSDILQMAARLSGQDYSLTVGSSGLDTDVERTLRVHVNAELMELWSQANWPGLRRMEERTYRIDYASGTTYQAGDEVFFPQTQIYYQAIRSGGFSGQAPADATDTLNSAYWALSKASYAGENYSATTAYAVGDIVYYASTDAYYQCHTASTGNAPSNTTYFGLLSEFDPYISLTQTGQTEIGENGPIHVYDANPDRETQVNELNYRMTDEGIQVFNGPVKVWVQFNIPAPELVGEPIDTSSAYAVDNQIQFATASGGVETIDFYDCTATSTAGQTPATNPSNWSRVEIPDQFRNYLGAKAAMALLVNDDDPRFAVADARAQAALNTLTENLYRGQNQTPRTRVVGAY